MRLVDADAIPYRKVVVPEYDYPIKMVSESVIKALPQVEPKKGYWIQHGYVFSCSNCGKWSIGYPYCPNCGADMRGEENDD